MTNKMLLNVGKRILVGIPITVFIFFAASWLSGAPFHIHFGNNMFGAIPLFLIISWWFGHATWGTFRK